MDTKPENSPFLFPTENYHRGTGIFRYQLKEGTEITGISSDSWEGFVKLLEQVSNKDKIVASPELITTTDIPFDKLIEEKSLIENRIQTLKDFSNNHPSTLFILGTPTFTEGKPRNSAVFVENGSIIATTNKRTGVTAEEISSFQLVPEEPPILIPGTKVGVLICSDYSTSTLYMREGPYLDRTLELAGLGYMIGKKPTFISPKAEALLLISCWGVGSRFKLPKEKLDEHYQLQLRNISYQVMHFTGVKEVVVVDQPMENPPYNGILTKTEV